jgi:hypothetical protein
MPREYIPYLFMALALVFVIRRGLRSMQGQRIRAENLWMVPVLLVLVAAGSIAMQPPHDSTGVGILAAATLAGAVAGWYRGKTVHITLDADTGMLTGRGSVIGMMLILAIYVGRMGVQTWARSHQDHSGTALLVADAALLFGCATLIVSRLEMWLRCRKLMADGTSAA